MSEESFSQLSIDRVSERAGLSRRTFFLHFASKDQLIAEVLEYLRPAHAEAYRQWTDDLPPDLDAEARIRALFQRIVEAISDPSWRGFHFLRISAEFGDRPEHPAHAVVAGAQQDMERWLEEELSRGPYARPGLLARQLVVMLNGLLIMQLVHRSPAYSAAVLSLLSEVLAAARGVA